MVASLSSRHPALRTARVRAKLRRGHPERLTLPLKSRQRARLEAAFAAGHAPTIIVHAVAHDANGTTVPVNLKVHPRKP